MSILKLKDLSLSINGKAILDDMNIDIWEGYVHSIVGPNGAGKSTLAYAIMGLSDYRNIDGDIIFDEKSIKELDVYERSKLGITLAWQEPARFEGVTIREFMTASAKEKNEDNISEALSRAALEPSDYLSRPLDKTLSGGERKKIELASIIVMEPELALLDEPDSGIDVASLEKMFELIKLMKKKGTTVILITHSLTVLKQAEHAFLICDGKIMDKGNVKKLAYYFENNCLPCDHKNKPDGTVKNIMKKEKKSE